MLKVNHIGIAVKKIENVLPFYQNVLKLTPHIEEVLTFKVRTAKLAVENTILELIEPLEGEEAVSKFLEKRGEGIHHICLEVPDIHKAMAELTQQGYKPLYPQPKVGAGGYLINFLSPKDTGGVLIEIAEVFK